MRRMPTIFLASMSDLHDRAVFDPDAAADLELGRARVRDHLRRAVLQAHDHLVVVGRMHALLDLVARVAAARGAEDLRDGSALTMADLAAEQGTRHAAYHHAEIAAFAL